MARTTATIQETMDIEQAAQSSLTDLNSPSQVAIYTLWKFIIATVINQLEQLWDLLLADSEEVIARAAVPSDRWLQSKVFEFQYDSVTPQIMTINSDFAPEYATVDATKRIITRCSVKTTSNRVVTVKVAKDDPPVALSVGELASLQGYLTQGGDGTLLNPGVGIGFAGVEIIASSLASDKVYLEGTIYYDGQYNSTIQNDVIQAIEDYLAAIPFDGVIKVIDLTDAIQNVAGVNDLLIENLAVRADTTAFASKTYLIQSFTQAFTGYSLFAGYCVEETTAGETFTDKLTFKVS